LQLVLVAHANQRHRNGRISQNPRVVALRLCVQHRVEVMRPASRCSDE
jgi:hypothetical protein